MLMLILLLHNAVSCRLVTCLIFFIVDNINKTVTLTKLCTELSSVAPKWYDLGIQLKVSHKTLNAIRAINKRNTEICLMRVCEEWLLQEKKCNVVPAWKTIIEVLNSKVISETELAGRIDQKYCRDETEGEEEEEEEEEPTSKSYTWVRLEGSNLLHGYYSKYFNAALTDVIHYG